MSNLWMTLTQRFGFDKLRFAGLWFTGLWFTGLRFVRLRLAGLRLDRSLSAYSARTIHSEHSSDTAAIHAVYDVDVCDTTVETIDKGMNRKNMKRSTRLARRTSVAVVSAGLALGLLTGCGNPTPSVESYKGAAQPVLNQNQEKKIRSQILQALTNADNAKSANGLDSVLDGPELDVRTSQINIAAKTNKPDAHATIPTDTSQVVITTTASWPRSVFTITTTTQDQQSQRLLVFRQDTARSNYKMWALVRLLQGAKMPAFEIPTIGSAAGSATDKGLTMTPQEAVKRYADVLQNGDNSKYKNDFDTDQFRTDLQQLTQTVQQGIEANKGSQSQTFTPTDQIEVMRSADGGDLVVARINSEWVRNAGEGRQSLPASDAEKALFGDAKATSTMKVSYVNVIALYVPKDGSKAKVRAVGAERQVTAVVAQ